MEISKLIVSLLIVLGVAGIAGRARAQNAAPDFTGTWALDLTKSKPDKRFPIKEQTIVITYTNQTIQFAYTTDGKPLPLSYVVDGKERTMPNPMFPKSDNFIKAEWKKSALDIVTVSRMGPLAALDALARRQNAHRKDWQRFRFRASIRLRKAIADPRRERVTIRAMRALVIGGRPVAISRTRSELRSVERWSLSDDGRTLTRKFDTSYIHSWKSTTRSRQRSDQSHALT